MNPCGWKVVHARISAIGPLSLEAGYDGLYVCFWRESIPLGHAELLRCELPLSDVQARNLAAAAIAPALRAYLVSRPELLLQVFENGGCIDRILTTARLDTSGCAETSLVICTRNRPMQLERCLRSVAAMNSQPAEIIVVDNTPGDAQTRCIAESLPNVSYLIEPHAGLSRARNAGVMNSSQPIIAFTDDDIVVNRDWLANLLTPFGDPDVWAVNGLVFPAELRTTAQLLFERAFGGFNQGYEPRRYGPDFLTRFGPRAAPVWSISTGGNMAVRRSAFEQAGLFDERLGAGAAGCSEDSEFSYRILSSGGFCVYEPRAVVHHYHREDIESLRRQIFLYMRGHVAALCAQYARSRQSGNLHRLCIELPREYAETLLRYAVSRDSEHRVLLTGALGCVAGVFYWLLHAKGGTVPRFEPGCYERTSDFSRHSVL